MILVAAALAAALAQQQAPQRVEVVEVFGTRTVAEANVREALGFGAGDPVPQERDAVLAGLRALPGVADVDLSAVCCGPGGGVLVFVGVREQGGPAPAHSSAPAGDVRLPQEMVEAGAAFERALVSAVQRGVTGDDASQGHSIMEDPAARAVQERFLGFAATRRDLLLRVLRESGDAEHRALAAQIVAYAPDKRRIVDDLVHAVGDPDDAVRNTTTRALALLAGYAAARPELGIDIPAAPFLELLRSHVWTDRNKGAMVLMALTGSGDAALLERVRSEALAELKEMARWRSDGHALPAFLILARIAGLEPAEAFRAWSEGRREEVIRSVTEPSPGHDRGAGRDPETSSKPSAGAHPDHRRPHVRHSAWIVAFR